MGIRNPVESYRVDVFQYDMLFYQNNVVVVLIAKLVIFLKHAKCIFYYFCVQTYFNPNSSLERMKTSWHSVILALSVCWNLLVFGASVSFLMLRFYVEFCLLKVKKY